MKITRALLGTFASVCLSAFCSAMPARGVAPYSPSHLYFWTVSPAGNTAQLVILVCRGCNTAPNAGRDTPLIAVLKDTLGDKGQENDRMTAVWLLSFRPPTLRQRLLSAVPFFYWRLGSSPAVRPGQKLKPELDMTALQHPTINAIGRDAFQWLMLDPSTMAIRATSRAYRTNEMDGERLALEESITYLRGASENSDGAGLTASEIATLIARLELRKRLLGGLVTPRGATEFGEADAAEHERVRSRNWEILRQCADKTGLYFEPLALSGTSGEYAVLWAPESGITGRAAGVKLKPIWKLLNVKQPSSEELSRLAARGYTRALDEDGNLLPFGTAGSRQAKLVPLSAYSLNYPKMPLLLVDFRNGAHVRWHAMTQRSINEVTAGVIGISHFTNWYYFVGADLYDFVATRHGAALNQMERLDCYSQFRVSLALDHQLDSRLREQMRQSIDALSMNPLETSAVEEMAAAGARSESLQKTAVEGGLEKLLDKDRRAELVSYSAGPKRALLDSILHLASFGSYTHRAPRQGDELARLDILRRAETQLAFLDSITAEGTQPEVAVDSGRIRHSLAELRGLLVHVDSSDIRVHAAETISRVQQLSRDGDLQSDCSVTLASLKPGGLTPAASDGIALQPGVIKNTVHSGSAAALR